ncbi:MAG: hypothetical protein IT285_10950 [Bdellovibrionales bacterium]|nr:hypothetical protein [Bdellovibrionales bacterium]
MTNDGTLPTWKLIYGLAYGALTAGVYLGLKMESTAGGLPAFALGSVVVFLVHMLAFPGRTMSALANYRLLARGALFAGSQLCILRAQSTAATSSAFAAAIAGTVSISFGAHLLLRESPTKLELLGTLSCVLGLATLQRGGELNAWALFGGLLQGTSALAARSLMVGQHSKRATVGSGSLMSALVCIPSLLLLGEGPHLTMVTPSALAITTLAIVLVQYTFMQLYTLLDAQKATLLSLSRVPWALSFEAVLTLTPLPLSKLIAAASILIGALLPLIRKPSKRKETQHAADDAR